MAKITYNTSPYTGDADLPHSPAVTHHCPDCKGLGRVSDILNGISIHKCPNCGGTGKIIQSDIILRDQPQATHHCINCEAAARTVDSMRRIVERSERQIAVIEQELADLKSDKAWADKLAAENADELSNLRREHEDLQARLAALLSARTPPYVSEIECNAYARGRADVLEELRALLAETEAE